MAKRRKLSQKGQSHAPKAGSGNQQQKGAAGPKKQGTGSSKTVSKHSPGQHVQRGHAEPTIPFAPEDKILLVGDGDLSFAASLIDHHYCADVTATVFEKNLEELQAKYPQVGENIAKIEAEDGKVMYNVDATKMGPYTDKKGKDGTGVMDRIIFNFPHVGGKSTDVNRQVRYNQELLVSFFERALLSLAPRGTIIVTLFEGEPYTLWNIRDLGRHAGLQVEKSFKFQASAYPGYHHARTLGVVKNKDGEIGGGWKGEERAARSYVFGRKEEEPAHIPFDPKTRKRARAKDDDSSDDD